MKKVQVVKRYTDMQLNRRVMQGEVMEVSDERAEQLLNVGVVVVVYEKEAVTDTKAPLKTPEAVKVELSAEEKAAKKAAQLAKAKATREANKAKKEAKAKK